MISLPGSPDSACMAALRQAHVAPEGRPAQIPGPPCRGLTVFNASWAAGFFYDGRPHFAGDRGDATTRAVPLPGSGHNE